MPWRLLVDGAHDGAFNMAMDQALFEDVQEGGPPVLRLYRWRPACLSFGRNQPARGLYDTRIARDLGVDFVRRPTGGQAVCHDRELTYAVAVPAGVLGRPRQAYTAINRILARALHNIGVPAGISPAPSTRDATLQSPARSDDGAGRRHPGDRSGAGAPPGLLAAGPCFREAAPGEVVVAGRKLIGSAQRAERKTILQHGSILIDGDQSIVIRIQRGPGMAPASTGIRQVIGREPGVDELCDAVTDAFSTALDVMLDPEPPGADVLARTRALEPRYRSDEWTWRR